jgi:hypothetical protein
MIPKTNIVAIALENQLNIFSSHGRYYTKCPKCIVGYLDLDEMRGFYYCFNCGCGGTTEQFDQMIIESKNCF